MPGRQGLASSPVSDYRCFRRGIKTVRKPRKCSQGHDLKPGDRVAFYVGIVEYDFTDWEECARCRDPVLRELHRELVV